MYQIGRSARYDRDAQVHHQLDLALCVAGAGRKNAGSDPLRSVVEAETSCEQAVSVGDLDCVIACYADRGHGPCEGFRPIVQIMPVVTHQRGLARGPGRDVVSDHVLRGDAEHLRRIIVPEIVLSHEGQFADVLQAGDVIGAHSCSLHFIMIEIVEFVEPHDERLQASVLSLLQVLDGLAFRVRVPEHVLIRTQLALPRIYFEQIFGK